MRKLLQPLISAFTGKFLGLIIQSVILLLLANLLLPKEFGEFAVAQTLAQIGCLIFGVGLPAANVYFLPSGELKLAALLSSNILIWALSLFFSAACFILLSAFGILFFSSESIATYQIVVLSINALLIHQLMSSLARGQLDFKVYKLSLWLQSFLSLLFISGIYLFSNVTAQNMLISWMLSQFLSAGIIGLKLKINFASVNFTLGLQNLKYVINYGWKAQLGNSVALLNYRLDLLMVNWLLGEASAGIYAIAVRLTERLWLFPQIFTSVIQPQLTFERSEDSPLGDKGYTLARFTLYFLAIVAIPFIIVVYLLYEFVLDSSFALGLQLVVILLGSTIVMSLTKVLSGEIAGRGRPDINLSGAVIALFTNVILNIVLVSMIGIYGAAIATAVAYLALTAFVIHKYFSITTGQESIGSFSFIDDYRLAKRFIKQVASKYRKST